MNWNPKYNTLDEVIKDINEINRESCQLLFNDNREIFYESKGSSHNHQNWKGGYVDHILETVNIADIIFRALSFTDRVFDFEFSDVLLILFLHDIEKPFKKEIVLVDDKGKKDRKKVDEFKFSLIKKYGIVLNDKQNNALTYIEGENEDYSNTKKTMNRLSAFCHMCDIWSARGWYDYPKK